MKLNVDVTLANVRPTKEDKGDFLVTKPTRGQLGISASVALALGVSAGDRVNVFGSRNENGEIDYYVAKGYKDASTVLGCKLAASGADFQFSGQNIWNSLGGDTEHNRYFDVKNLDVEGYDVKIDLPDGSESFAYPIVFREAVEKQHKSSSDDAENTETPSASSEEAPNEAADETSIEGLM
jgi:hypothetical protein